MLTTIIKAKNSVTFIESAVKTFSTSKEIDWPVHMTQDEYKKIKQSFVKKFQESERKFLAAIEKLDFLQKQRSERAIKVHKDHVHSDECRPECVLKSNMMRAANYTESNLSMAVDAIAKEGVKKVEYKALERKSMNSVN